MTKSEKAVELAGKLYGARRAMLSIHGREKYLAHVADYRPYIEQAMKGPPARGLMEAGMHVYEKLIDNKSPGGVLAMLLATLVEMAEPLPPE